MSSASATINKSHVTCTPGVCGGKPCIAGSRIRVQDIYVWHEMLGQSPDEIVSNFPQLTLADVYGALTYLWDNRQAILRDMEEQRKYVEEMKAKTPSLLEEKLKVLKANVNPLSS